MAENVGYLLGGEGFYVAVIVLDAVDQSGCEGVAERVQAFCFYSGGFENSVETFAEVDRSGDCAVLVGDEWTVLAEVKFFAQIFYHFDGGVIERNFTLAGGAF